MSVALWLKLHSGSNGNNIISNIEGGSEAHANGVKIDHKESSKTLVFALKYELNGTKCKHKITRDEQWNQFYRSRWEHWVITWRVKANNDKMFKLFKKGGLKDSDTSCSSWTKDTDDCTIGMGEGNSGFDIDELVVWNRDLSEDEVKQFYDGYSYE